VESSPKAEADFVKCRKWNRRFMKRIVYVTAFAVQTKRKKNILAMIRCPTSICICKACGRFFRNYHFLSSCDPEHEHCQTVHRFGSREIHLVR
jgi:hypothetical protein